MSNNSTAPGWYQDPAAANSLRYWDGIQWTQHTSPVPTPTQVAQPAPPANWYPDPEDASRVRYWNGKKWTKRVRLTEEALAVYQEEQKAWELEVEQKRISEKAEKIANEQAIEQAFYENIILCGSKLRPAAFRSVLSHSHEGETPWLVIHSSFAGVLAAYDDRLLIIKTGAFTAWAAGVLGGGRITTFLYSEITGIEYNGQLVNGVLEILTPSYQGTQNQDFWKGTFQPINSDSSNPQALSNTLPLGRFEYNEWLPHINELRKRITEAKKPVVKVEGVPVQQHSLTEELRNLAELKSNGVIDEIEYAQLKSQLLQTGYLTK